MIASSGTGCIGSPLAQSSSSMCFASTGSALVTPPFHAAPLTCAFLWNSSKWSICRARSRGETADRWSEVTFRAPDGASITHSSAPVSMLSSVTVLSFGSKIWRHDNIGQRDSTIVPNWRRWLITLPVLSFVLASTSKAGKKDQKNWSRCPAKTSGWSILPLWFQNRSTSCNAMISASLTVSAIRPRSIFWSVPNPNRIL